MRFFSFFCRAILLTGLQFGALSVSAQAQHDEVWTQFEKKVGREYRYGYRDAAGRVRLPATFGNFTNAQRFRHIMAVSLADNSQLYYLLKDGRPVGRDSVYMSGDYEVACESEGSILFRDWRKDRVGFFNAQGRVLIPAIYNYATPFHNGVAVALRGARRACGGGDPDTLHCEHRTWAGGRQVLINQRNEVLADLATAPARDFRLNWYSLQRNAPTPDTATTVTLTGPTGERYTFIDYDREFRQWFFGAFVSAVRSGEVAKIKSLCFSELAVAARPFRGWPHFSQAAFVTKYQAVLKTKLGRIQKDAAGVSLGAGHLNTFIFTGPVFQQFLTDCGQHFEEKYPVYEVVLTYPTQPAHAAIDYQEQFEFIRTAGGYRLLSVSL